MARQKTHNKFPFGNGCSALLLVFFVIVVVTSIIAPREDNVPIKTQTVKKNKKDITPSALTNTMTPVQQTKNDSTYKFNKKKCNNLEQEKRHMKILAAKEYENTYEKGYEDGYNDGYFKCNQCSFNGNSYDYEYGYAIGKEEGRKQYISDHTVRKFVDDKGLENLWHWEYVFEE